MDGPTIKVGRKECPEPSGPDPKRHKAGEAPHPRGGPTYGTFYAVMRGRKPGVYRIWAEAQKQVSGYSGAVYKKFKTLEAAEAFLSSVVEWSEVAKWTTTDGSPFEFIGKIPADHQACGIFVGTAVDTEKVDALSKCLQMQGIGSYNLGDVSIVYYNTIVPCNLETLEDGGAV